jgi:hypothetical protein
MDWRQQCSPASAALAAVLLMALAGCGRETGKPGHETYIVRKPWGGQTTYVETLQGVESTALNMFYETAEQIDVRPQRHEETFNVTVEGDVNIEFRAHIVLAVRPDGTKDIVENIGANYYATKVKNPFREAVRAEVTQYKVFEVKERRKAIADAILADMQELFKDAPFVIIDVLTGNVDYDRQVKESAVRAAVKKEESNQRDIQLQIQAKDNAIKEIEAEGIREAQEIIRDSLTRRYNKWNGLKAIEELAGGTDEATGQAKPPENTTFIFLPLRTGGDFSIILGESMMKPKGGSLTPAPRRNR